MTGRIYRVKMLAHPRHPDVPEGYYGPVSGITQNLHIYCRVPKREDAFLLTAHEAINFIRGSNGWPCKCEPPLTVTY